MPVLRLFAGARDAAGTGRDEVPGSTVGEVLEAARRRYGADFARVLDSCRVWVNGEGSDERDPVGEGDEVAILPPVSGGAAPTAQRRRPPPRPRGKSRRSARARRRRPTRYAVVYDVDGPRVRLGFLWFVAAMGGLFLGENGVGLAVPYSVAGAFAGLQMATVWREHGRHPNKAVAAAVGGVAPAAATAGAGAVGLVLIAAVPLAVFAALAESGSRRKAVSEAGFTLQCSIFVGLAAASPVLAIQVEVGAALALILLVSIYEMGDYLIGSGATNSIEGPAAGIAGIAVFTFALWVASIPPFRNDSILAFGAMAAVFAPVGQLFGSALLPRADSPASAMRRLDTLLILGPVFVVTLWAYLDML